MRNLSTVYSFKPQEASAAREYVKTETQAAPTTGQVFDATISETFGGQGSLSELNTRQEAFKARTGGRKISEDEFKNSNYNPNITWNEGMTEEEALVLDNYHAQRDANQFLLERATSGQGAMSFVTGIGASFFEPKQFITGLTAGLFTGGAGAVGAKVTGRSLYALNKTKRAFQVGALSAAAEGAVAVPLDIATSKALQTDYDYVDGAIDTLTGAAFGVAIDVGAVKYGSWKQKKQALQQEKIDRQSNPLEFAIIDNASEYGVSEDYIYSMIMAESGLGQMMPELQEKYGITKESSIEEQVKAVAKMTQDKAEEFKAFAGRMPKDDTERYMAHWLGAAGAAEVTTAPKHVGFVEHMKQTKYYKRKDGTSYARLVLKQNNLPRDATMAEVIEASRQRIDKHKGTSKFIPEATPELMEKMDFSVQQAIEGRPINPDAIVAKQIERVYKNGERFIDQNQKKYLEQIKTIENDLNQFTETLDYNLDPTPIADNIEALERVQIASIETRIKETREKIRKFQEDKGINAEYAPTDIEIDYEFYKAEMEDLRQEKRRLRKLQEDIFNLRDYDDQIDKLTYDNLDFDSAFDVFKGRRLSKNTLKPLHKALEIDPQGTLAKDLAALDITPKTAIGLFKKGGIKSADNLRSSEWTDYNLADDGAGYVDRDALTQAIADSFDDKTIDLTRQRMLNEFKINPKETNKEQFKEYLRSKHGISRPLQEFTTGDNLVDQMNKELSEKLNDIKLSFNKTKNNIDQKAKGILDHSKSVQSRIEGVYRDSLLNDLEALNGVVYDKPLIEEVEAITEEIKAKTTDQHMESDIEKFEAIIKDYEEAGLLDEEIVDILNKIDSISDEDFNNIQRQTETCLLTGGLA